MDRRLFPLSVEFFRQDVKPLIAGHHNRLILGGAPLPPPLGFDFYGMYF